MVFNALINRWRSLGAPAPNESAGPSASPVANPMTASADQRPPTPKVEPQPVDDPFRPLKNALGRFATGIAVIACRGDEPAGAPVAAITVNSFNSVSLDPPLVLWSIEKSASSFDSFMAADGYGVSLLHAGQEATSNQFARAGAAVRAGDLFETLAPDTAERRSEPVLKDRLAAFDCRLVDRHEAGDHVILIGRVELFDTRAGAPLIYFASRYGQGPRAD